MTTSVPIPPNPSEHHVFVDFENVPNIDLELIGGKDVHVTFLIGKNQTKISLDLVQCIRSYAAQVELIEVGASGHNALDLTLAYYLGQAVQRSPDTCFWIVSKDKDFGPMISHLHHRAVKVRVERCSGFDQLPFLQPTLKPKATQPSTTIAAAAPVDRRTKLVARLRDSSAKNRPTKRAALSAHLKTSLGSKATDAEVAVLISELVEAGTIAIDPADKVSYPTQK